MGVGKKSKVFPYVFIFFCMNKIKIIRQSSKRKKKKEYLFLNVGGKNSVVQVVLTGRGHFVSLAKWGLIDVVVRITLKEISFSPVPLNLSQESQALPCFHLTGKPTGKRKFSATAIDGISCTGFSPTLVLLGSLPQVFRKTVVMQHVVSDESGLCLAPAVQTC